MSSVPPVLNPIGDRITEEGELLEFSIAVSDSGTGEIEYEYAATPLPDGSYLDVQTGFFTWKPSYEQAGDYTITFITRDESGAETSETVKITVTEATPPPVLNVRNQIAKRGETLTFQVEAADSLSFPLTYSASNLPLDATFDPSTQTFSWTPEEPGNYQVTFHANNGSRIGSKTISILVSMLPHIHTYASIYTIPDTTQIAWAQSHIDMSTPKEDQKVTNVTLEYVNWSFLGYDVQNYQGTYQLFDRLGLDFDDVFVHYAEDVYVPTSQEEHGSVKYNNMMEDRFFKVIKLKSPIWNTGWDGSEFGALQLDGLVDYGLQAPPHINSMITDSNQITFEAWIKPESQKNTGIVDWDVKNGLWIDGSGNLAAEINVDHTRRGAISRYSFANPPPNINPPCTHGTWCHIVGTGDAVSGYTRLFVNGQEYGTAQAYPAGNITELNGNLKIGKIGGGIDNFKGLLDDVRIYARALSPAEIQTRYLANRLIKNDLIAHWTLDKTGEMILADSSDEYHPIHLRGEDITATASGQIATGTTSDIALGADQNDILYIGHTWPFRLVNFNIAQAAWGGWNGVWEYWNGTEWTKLTIKTDGTAEMRQTGRRQIVFDPPLATWQKTKLNDQHLYWLRLRNTSSGTAPVFQSVVERSAPYEWKGTSAIRHESYAVESISQKDHYKIPGWNDENDPNGDGFVDDAEFASLAVPNATARFKYQSRVHSYYFTGTWMTNLGMPLYREHLAQKTLDAVSATGVEGTFVDNMLGVIIDYLRGYGSKYIEYPGDNPNLARREDVVLAAQRLKEKLGSKTVIINGATPEVAAEVDGVMFENEIVYGSSATRDNDLESFWNKVKSLEEHQVAVVIHADPNISLSGITPADPAEFLRRHNMYGLANYYLTATDTTLLKYQDSDNGFKKAWDDWFQAIEYDIGKPTGDLYLYKPIRRNYPAFEPYPLDALDTLNASFEDNDDDIDLNVPDGWTKNNPPFSNIPWAVDDTASADGINSFRISATPDFPSPGIYRSVELKPNTTYTLSGWMKTKDLSSQSSLAALVSVYCQWGIASGQPDVGLRSGTRNWTFVSTTFTTGTCTTNCVPCNIYGARLYQALSGTAWFDGIMLEEGDFPLEKLFARNYSKGLVLLKPLPSGVSNPSYGNDTKTDLTLPASYKILDSQGDLSNPTNQVSIRNFEGLILVAENPPPVGAPPVIAISGVTDGEITKESRTPVISITDADNDLKQSALSISRDNQEPKPFQSGTEISEEGTYRLEVSAEDRAGNPPSTASVRFAIDRTSPEIIISGVSNGQKTNQAITPLVQVSDLHPNSQKTKIWLNGEEFASGTELTQYNDYSLTVSAEDAAGNPASAGPIQFSIQPKLTVQGGKITKNITTDTVLHPPATELIAPVDSRLEIEANPSSANFRFLQWTGDTETVQNASESTTQVTLAKDVILTAEYIELFQLVVVGGTGGGTYPNGEKVTITANIPPKKAFGHWEVENGNPNDLGELKNAATGETDVTVRGPMRIRAVFIPPLLVTVAGGAIIQNLTQNVEFNPPVPEARADEGDQFKIRANILPKHRFLNWRSAPENANVSFLDTKQSETTVTINENAALIAEFLAQAALTASGVVRVKNMETGELFDHPTTLFFDPGTLLEITADVPEGARFDRWTDDTDDIEDILQETVQVRMTKDKNLTAKFIRRFTLTVTDGGTGSGTYDEDELVEISTEIPAGHRFDRWAGGSQNSIEDASQAKTKVRITGHMTLSPVFIRQFTLTITVIGKGTVTPAAGTHLYDEDASISITAVSEPQYFFSDWSGAASDRNETITIKMSQEQSLTAHFVYDPTPPVVIITTPAENNLTVNAKELIVQGVTNEPVKRVIIAGNSATLISPTSFKISVPLVNGLNTLKATATDLAENIGTSGELKITYRAPANTGAGSGGNQKNNPAPTDESNPVIPITGGIVIADETQTSDAQSTQNKTENPLPSNSERAQNSSENQNPSDVSISITSNESSDGGNVGFEVPQQTFVTGIEGAGAGDSQPAVVYMFRPAAVSPTHLGANWLQKGAILPKTKTQLAQSALSPPSLLTAKAEAPVSHRNQLETRISEPAAEIHRDFRDAINQLWKIMREGWQKLVRFWKV